MDKTKCYARQMELKTEPENETKILPLYVFRVRPREVLKTGDYCSIFITILTLVNLLLC